MTQIAAKKRARVRPTDGIGLPAGGPPSILRILDTASIPWQPAVAASAGRLQYDSENLGTGLCPSSFRRMVARNLHVHLAVGRSSERRFGKPSSEAVGGVGRGPSAMKARPMDGLLRWTPTTCSSSSLLRPEPEPGGEQRWRPFFMRIQNVGAASARAFLAFRPGGCGLGRWGAAYSSSRSIALADRFAGYTMLALARRSRLICS